MLAAQTIIGHRFFTFIVFSLLVHDANANVLRKSSVPERSLEEKESLICELAILDAQFENQDGREIYQCLTSQSGFGDLASANDQNGDLAYTIDLPSDFLDKHKDCKGKRYGPCMISVPGGTLLHGDDGEPFVSIPDDSTITVVEGSGSKNRQLSITGNQETLVVRVTIDGNGPEPSITDLAGSVFGLLDNPAEQSMAGQYSACSFGQLQFYPSLGDNIENGVMNIEISNETLSILSLLSDLEIAVEAKIPSNINPDHIMYVVPYGTEFQGNYDWIAFAYVGGYTSFYNNKWGDYLSTQMHEVGHNLGFHHSSEGSVSYGDTTGIMGYSYAMRGGPLMCFDGFKAYMLGWYSDKTAVVNDTWTGQLAAFVDYANDAATTVLIKVGNAHVMFNRKKGMNSGTDEKGDLVTITEGTEAGLQSYNLGGLSKGQNLTVNGAVIEICDMVISEDESVVDYATVSIYNMSHGSDCREAQSQVFNTSQPTSAPTPPPTPLTTPPTLLPTSSPTPPPPPTSRSTPSATAPTPLSMPPQTPPPTPPPPPTPRPTQEPTPRPTQAPTPTPRPTPMPAPPPTVSTPSDYY